LPQRSAERPLAELPAYSTFSLGPERAPCAGPVVHHHLRAEPLAELLRDHSRKEVRASAGREADDEGSLSGAP